MFTIIIIYCFSYQPFYVGKGSFYSSQKKPKKLRFYQYVNLKYKGTHRYNTIQKIIQETGEYPLVKYYDIHITEKEAFEQEKYLIALIGRKDLKEGLLINHTNGGEGEFTELMKEKHLKAVAGNDYKKIISEKSKENWKDPVYRKKCIKTGYDHPGKRIVHLFNLDGDQLKKFDFLKDCATYLKTSSANVKKVIDKKSSWKEQYFIAYSDVIDINDYKLTKSKDIKVKKENKFILDDNNLPIKKHCNRCDTYKGVSKFGKNKNLTHGIGLYCKECDKERLKKPRNAKRMFVEYDRALPKHFQYDENNKPIKKRCNRCDTFKDLNKFFKNKALAYGIGLYCKECDKIRRNAKYIFKQYDRK